MTGAIVTTAGGTTPVVRADMSRPLSGRAPSTAYPRPRVDSCRCAGSDRVRLGSGGGRLRRGAAGCGWVRHECPASHVNGHDPLRRDDRRDCYDGGRDHPSCAGRHESSALPPGAEHGIPATARRLMSVRGLRCLLPAAAGCCRLRRVLRKDRLASHVNGHDPLRRDDRRDCYDGGRTTPDAPADMSRLLSGHALGAAYPRPRVDSCRYAVVGARAAYRGRVLPACGGCCGTIASPAT